MFSILDACGKSALRVALALAIMTPCGSAGASGFNVLHSFGNGKDGMNPFGDMIVDEAGNLYGTTYFGGAQGRGIVFRLSPRGHEKVLVAMPPGEDGPYAGMIADAAGDLYGTTVQGGTGDYGTIFMLAPDGTLSVVHNFGGGTDGSLPYAGLTAAKSGDFFGATFEGGSGNCGGEGCGTIYRISPNGKEKVLYAFQGGSDGQLPYTAPVVDGAGNLFGTTYEGGAGDCGGGGCGTVFKLGRDGTKTILHAFTGGADGGSPIGKLVADGAGNFYGTSYSGGIAACGAGCGTVFKLDAGGAVSVVYSFKGGSDGANPSGGVIMDSRGRIYGTTTYGGAAGAGTVFRIVAKGTEAILYAFGGGTDGANPYAGLTPGVSGKLYGTTAGGGAYGQGVVFGVKP